MRKVHQCLYMYMLYTHSIIMSVRLHVSLCVFCLSYAMTKWLL